jgi:YidC/Oxa1 family membrane protein insertase
MPDNRNLIIAIALSLVVLVVWQFFVAGPQLEKAQQQQEQVAKQAESSATSGTTSGATSGQTSGTQTSGQTGGASDTATSPATSGTTPATVATAATLTRDAALATSQRVQIKTGALTGSINLTGARIDDLHLSQFHETVDDTSPTIVLLSPSGGQDAYFAEFCWIVPVDAGTLPGPQTVWTAPAGAVLTAATPVTLTYANGSGLTFTRTIAIDDKYMFTVTDQVANAGPASVSLSPFGRITRVGEPKIVGYWILHEGLIGVFGDKGLKEEKYKAIKDDKEQKYDEVTQGWLGITDKYWAAALIPDQAKPFSGRFIYAEHGAPVYQADYHGDAQSIAPGASLAETSHLFAGAKQVAILDNYRDTLNIKLFDRLIDWGWFWFFTKPLFYLMDWFFHVFGNFGVAVLAVTVIVKGAFFPLANKSYRSMAAMKKVQPQMTALREQYKDDKVKQQQSLMELYKKEKINPLAGCWPVAIQIPVFFSLYKVLFVTIEMRHAPFFGWIRDLSAPDPSHIFNLFGLLPYDPAAIPVIGAFLAIGLWPVIMGITMFVQMRLNPTPPDPAQAMIFTWMPLIFTFMLASFPAGLVIYWAWNNTLSVTQQYFIMRRYGTEVNLWGNILESLGLRPKQHALAKVATAPAAAANDDDDSDAPLPSGKRKKPKAKR